MDRRIRRTHKLLVDALVSLALRDGYDAVTIRDITEYAAETRLPGRAAAAGGLAGETARARRAAS